MLKIRYIVTYAICMAAAVTAAGAALAADADQQAAAEKERQLIGVLQSDAPPQDKAITCKRLAVYGSEKAVPALAPLLADAQLASWARIALEVIPGPAADNAFREAAGKVQGRLLVGVINSMGVRRDAKAIETLVPKLKDADAEVASAAAVALGRIGGRPAAEALEQSLSRAPAAVRNCVAEGCILCAEKFLAEGNRDEAARLCDLVRKADVPKQKVLEATRGAIIARQSDGIPILVEQLRSADKAMLGMALRVARELASREVTDALVAELGKAPPDRQALQVLALADRGDAAALPAILTAAKDGPSSVRIAAVGAIQRLGNASCLPVLLEAAIAADADVVQAAKAALANMPGKEVNAEIVARLGEAEGKTRQLLVALAGERQIAAALPALLKAADDPDAQVRAAALTALGSTISLGDLQVLIHRVVEPHDAQETKAAMDALNAACVRMADREACAEKLVAAMAQAPAPAKVGLLQILGAMGGEKSLAAIGAAAKASSPEVQDAASRLLGEWMSVDAAPVLLDLAKTATDSRYQTRALRGYLRIARQLDVPLDQRIAMCREAAKVCQRDDERKLVLEVLSRHPSAAGLPVANQLLRSAGVKAAARTAAVAIAEKVIQSDPAAVADAMRQVVEAGGDAGVTNRAKALLDRAAQKK